MKLIEQPYILLILIIYTAIFGQETNWKIFQTSNSNIPSNIVTAISQDNSGYYWFGFANDNSGNEGGLYKYNLYNWEKVDINSIDFSSTQITDIKPAGDNIYISTFGEGIIKLSNVGSEIFNMQNSDLLTNDIICIAVESENKIWFGTYWGGLLKYENNQFINYTTQNSGLVFDEVSNIVIDRANNKWIGTDGMGIVKFDDTTWTTFQCQDFLGIVPVFGLSVSSNNDVWTTTGGNGNRIGYIRTDQCFSFSNEDIGYSILPTYPFGLDIDSRDVKWIGSSAGLVKYNDYNWEIINSDNSPLPGDAWISNLFVDKNDNIWFAFSDTLENSVGLACYNENGITNIEENYGTQQKFFLYQNYPNPFNPTTIIEYSIPNVGRKNLPLQLNVKLIIYDIIGREITTLVNRIQSPGNYSVKFNGNNLPSGVYFYTLRVNDFVQSRKMILLR